MTATLSGIIAATCEEYGVSAKELIDRVRSPRLNRARQVAMYLCRAHTSHSFPEIGRAFCRDHTTVMYGSNAIERVISIDRVLFDRTVSIMKTAHSPQALKKAKSSRELIDKAIMQAKFISNNFEISLRVMAERDPTAFLARVSDAFGDMWETE